MNRITLPGVGHFAEHGLEPFLELAAELRAGHQGAMSSAITRRFFRLSGTSASTIRRASPSAMAVLPTPGSPISTGLFFVRGERTWMTRRIS